MLVEYGVGNYKSIKEMARISMEAYTRDKKNKDTVFNVSEDLKILPVACIYGQNASGKSNVLESIAFLQHLVIDSKSFEKKYRIYTNSFAFDDVSRDSPTEFYVDFINGDRYNYTVSVSDGRIAEEVLKRNDEVLFRRTGDKLEMGRNIPKEDKKKIEFVMDLTNENSLLLSKCSQSKIDSLIDAYNWFDEKLYTIHADRPLSPPPEMMRDALNRHGQKVIEMLSRADLGISDINIEEIDLDPLPEEHAALIKLIREMNRKGEIKSFRYDVEHDIGSKKYSLGMENESSGTKKIAGLIIHWLDALENGGMLVIDELEACMHPLLVDLLIDHIARPDVNTNNAQLLFTTHDALLAKRNAFRRDQVWFVSRDPNIGVTSLYSWLDYDVRSDLEFTKNYLAGRFGAIPRLKRIGDE